MKFLIIALLLFTVSCKKDDKTAAQPKPVEVGVIEIDTKPLNIRKPSTGFIEAEEKVEIRARIEGFLEKKLFNDGQKVKAGDKLFIIEQDKYQANVNAAKADLAMALAEEKRDKLQYERAKALIQSKTISQAKYDDQSATYEVSKAKVGQTKASLKQAELNLSYTVVTSPVDGTVSDNNYDVGNYVSLESTPLTTVVSSSRVKVSFTISEKYLFKLLNVLKQPIESLCKYTRAVLFLPDGTEYKYKGTINFVDNLIDRKTNTLRLKAVFDNPDDSLKDGQYAKIAIETIKPVPAYVLPQTLLLVDQQGRYVFGVDKDNKVIIKRIETSGNYGNDVLVTKGIKKGDVIITQGYQSLKAGMTVVPRKEQDVPAKAGGQAAPTDPAKQPEKTEQKAKK